MSSAGGSVSFSNDSWMLCEEKISIFRSVSAVMFVMLLTDWLSGIVVAGGNCWSNGIWIVLLFDFNANLVADIDETFLGLSRNSALWLEVRLVGSLL